MYKIPLSGAWDDAIAAINPWAKKPTTTAAGTDYKALIEKGQKALAEGSKASLAITKRLKGPDGALYEGVIAPPSKPNYVLYAVIGLAAYFLLKGNKRSGYKKNPGLKSGKHCDICSKRDLNTYVDGKTTQGPWGDLCMKCWMQRGVGLGTGKGQKYSWDGLRWIKLAG